MTHALSADPLIGKFSADPEMKNGKAIGVLAHTETLIHTIVYAQRTQNDPLQKRKKYFTILDPYFVPFQIQWLNIAAVPRHFACEAT